MHLTAKRNTQREGQSTLLFCVRPAGRTCSTVIIMKIDKSLLLARQGEGLAEGQLRYREVSVGRKPMAKHWSDEQESHTRQSRGMRRHRTLKSKSCMEGVDVYAADISVKVSAHYPGRSPFLFGNKLSSQRCAGKEGEKSAEIIVARIRSRAKDRTEERQRGLRP